MVIKPRHQKTKKRLTRVPLKLRALGKQMLGRPQS